MMVYANAAVATVSTTYGRRLLTANTRAHEELPLEPGQARTAGPSLRLHLKAACSLHRMRALQPVLRETDSHPGNMQNTRNVEGLIGPCA